MFKTAFLAYKGLNKLRQMLVVFAVVAALLVASVAGFKIWLAVHDGAIKNDIKTEVLNDVNNKAITVQNNDKKRVDNASDAIGAVRDCIKLSRVYGTDECKRGEQQAPPENDIQTTTITDRTQFEGAGSLDFAVGRLPLPMGGVFPDSTEKQGVQKKPTCYPEKVSDEFGLPVWVYDADGLLVQQEIQVCQ